MCFPVLCSMIYMDQYVPILSWEYLNGMLGQLIETNASFFHFGVRVFGGQIVLGNDKYVFSYMRGYLWELVVVYVVVGLLVS